MSPSRAHVSVCLDNVLGEIGSFGPYQAGLFALILLPIMANAIYNAQYVFCAGAVEYRCMVPECESSSAEFEAGEWSKWALVPGEPCLRYTAACAAPLCPCGAESFTNKTQRCDSWLYASHNTIVSEFGLACHDWQRAMVGTIHSTGVFTALAFVGYISDRIGRRTTFILTATSVAAVGVAKSFSTSYIVYIILEFFDALLGSGSYSTGFILGLEMIHPSRRVLAACSMSSTFAVGQMVLAIVAWAVPYWRTLLRVLYAPSFLFIFYYFFIDESVRWLFSVGKDEQARRVLLRVARLNKKQPSPETVKQLAETAEASKLVTQNEPAKSIFKQVLASRIMMRRLLVCSFCWMTVVFVYYGLSINSVSLAGNMYMNYALTSLAEIPGYVSCVFMLDRFGRKTSIMTALSICGGLLILLPFVTALAWAREALTLVAKSCVSMAFSGVYLQVGELFPTAARHTIMNVCSMFGRVGTTGAMLTPLLMAYVVWLPYLLFGLMAIIAAALLTLTPETLRTTLPDTVAQAEAMRRHSLSETAPAATGIQTRTVPPSERKPPDEKKLPGDGHLLDKK